MHDWGMALILSITSILKKQINLVIYTIISDVYFNTLSWMGISAKCENKNKKFTKLLLLYEFVNVWKIRIYSIHETTQVLIKILLKFVLQQRYWK